MTRVNKRIDIEIGHFVVANLVNFSEYTNSQDIKSFYSVKYTTIQRICTNIIDYWNDSFVD